MQELKNILQEAEKLKKNGNFAEAAALYEIQYSNDEVRKDKWVGWNLAHCLRKAGNPNKALDICREVYKIDPKFEQNNNLYAWCIYDTHIKIIQNDNDFMKAAEGIVSLTSQENEFSPYTRTVYAVVDHLKKKPSYSSEQILHWINRLNPSLLDIKSSTIKGENGKDLKLASDLEKYYTTKSKALFENSQFADCIKICNEALSKISEFHYSNDVWLRRERAHCKAKMGDIKTAIEELESILLLKKDWFIQHEIGQLFFELGDKDKALSYCVEAVL
ncbi:MAG: tetratricopeptide repeat protein, partial [Bacteroidia bacterium]|nr:tetratricopeptide repeat protein [Bacteroidia bacterium]